jgi:phosphate transport system permease protein
MISLRLVKSRIGNMIITVMTFSMLLLLLAMGLGLFLRSQPLTSSISLGKLLFSSSWHPAKGEFGYLYFLLGTLIVSLCALVVAVPISIFTAIYLSEYARKKVFTFFKSLIDILASIPSVIYGLWGILIIIPFVKESERILCTIISFITGNQIYPSGSEGYSLLSAVLVLSVMILPFIIHVILEVLKSISLALREATLAMGATRWETIKYVVVRKALPGIIAACGLGLTRALGETMAVMMVAGNIAQIPRSPFESVYTLPALIANKYGEMFSIPLYDSALMFAALLLFLVVLVFNLISRFVIYQVKRRL